MVSAQINSMFLSLINFYKFIANDEKMDIVR